MRQPTAAPATSAPDAGRERWRARWPWLARTLWLALVGAMLTIVLGSLPIYQAHIRLPCTPVRCDFQQLTDAQLATLILSGISLDGYVALSTALLLVGIAISLALSALIIWRRARSSFGAERATGWRCWWR
jgi:cell division protein FtsX